MVVILVDIGLFSPPFGVGYYVACAISRTKPDEGLRPILGYMIALIIGLIVVVAVPCILILQTTLRVVSAALMLLSSQ